MKIDLRRGEDIFQGSWEKPDRTFRSFRASNPANRQLQFILETLVDGFFTPSNSKMIRRVPPCLVTTRMGGNLKIETKIGNVKNMTRFRLSV